MAFGINMGAAEREFKKTGILGIGGDPMQDFLMGKEGEEEVVTRGLLTPEQEALLKTTIGAVQEPAPELATTKLGAVGDATAPTIAPRTGEAPQVMPAPRAQGVQIGAPTPITAPTGLPTGVESASGQIGEPQIQAPTAPLSREDLSFEALSGFREQQAGEQKALGAEARGGREEAAELLRQTTKGATPEEREARFQAGVVDPLEKQLSESLRRAGRKFSAGGFFSSERQREDALATEQFTNALTRERADFMVEARQQDIANLQAASAGLAGISGQAQAGISPVVGAATATFGTEAGLMSKEAELGQNVQLTAFEEESRRETRESELGLEADIQKANLDQRSAEKTADIGMQKGQLQLQTEMTNLDAQIKIALSQGDADLARSLSDQRTQTETQLKQADIDTEMVRLEETRKLEQAKLETQVTLSNLQKDLELSVQQGKITAAEAQTRYQGEFQRLQNMIAAASVSAIENIQFQTPAQPGAAQGIVQGAGAGLGQYLGGLSDKRLKIHIEKINERLNLSWYRWKWRDEAKFLYGFGEEWAQGFLAQEVEEKYPSAVRFNEHGYKEIDYKELIFQAGI